MRERDKSCQKNDVIIWFGEGHSSEMLILDSSDLEFENVKKRVWTFMEINGVRVNLRTKTV